MTFGTVVLGGGSGFVGRAINRHLTELGYNVIIISRQPSLKAMSWNEVSNQGLPQNCVAVINVAGQNVLDPMRRWTSGFKQNVYASRVSTTRLLAQLITKAPQKPEVFGVISGVGFYPPSETDTYTEDSAGGKHDFLAQLCSDWENASVLPSSLGVRRFVVRSGVVLGRSGGMVQQLFWPFYFGLGGPIASGSQYLPWVHLRDIAGIFAYGITTDSVEGVLNGVAPELVTNRQFTSALGRAMWRPTFLPMPAAALKLAFGDERARMMTHGHKILPKRTLALGYQFMYPDIQSACKEVARVFTDPGLD